MALANVDLGTLLDDFGGRLIFPDRPAYDPDNVLRPHHDIRPAWRPSAGDGAPRGTPSVIEA